MRLESRRIKPCHVLAHTTARPCHLRRPHALTHPMRRLMVAPQAQCIGARGCDGARGGEHACNGL